MNRTFGVHSEVGQLRQAVIHRPGLELSRLTPANREELLFDDVLWAARAREEHDTFAGVLREHGVEVHHFDTLLTETLEIAIGPTAPLTSPVRPPTGRGRTDTLPHGSGDHGPPGADAVVPAGGREWIGATAGAAMLVVLVPAEAKARDRSPRCSCTGPG